MNEVNNSRCRNDVAQDTKRYVPDGATSGVPRPTPADLRTLLSPTSIAIVGASSDREKFGGRFLFNLLQQGFAGALYPVNPNQTVIGGFRCYPDARSLPAPVDCTIHALDAASLPETLDACSHNGTRLLIVTCDGFSERGDAAGQLMHDLLCEFVSRTGIRVIGPNCVGFINNQDMVGAAAAAMLSCPLPQSAGIGVISQSGGLGLGTVLYYGYAERSGFSYLISTGNEVDLDAVDFARLLVADPRTHVLVLTLEGVRDGPAFVELLESARVAGKPVAILKSGRSELGKKLALSHTGALAGSDEAFGAVCARYGAVVVEDIGQLYRIARMFEKMARSGTLQKMKGSFIGKCAAVSISGGHIGLFVDIAARVGIKFPAFGDATEKLLQGALSGVQRISNPLDMSGGAVSDPDIWARCVSIMAADPEIRVTLPLLTVSRNYDQAIKALVKNTPSNAGPTIVTWTGGALEGAGKELLEHSNIPWFSSANETVEALMALETFVTTQDRTAESHPPLINRTIPPIMQTALITGQQTLGEREAKLILRDLGFTVVNEEHVVASEHLLAAARKIGYPLVIKGAHSQVQHKTEAGLVRLGISNDSDLLAEYRNMVDRMATIPSGDVAPAVLLQEMLNSHFELFLGGHIDPTFGPMLSFGLGGIFVEALRDIRLVKAPLTFDDAMHVIVSSRCAALLDGARGGPKVDLKKLAQLLVSLGDALNDWQKVVESIDINPIIVTKDANDNLRVADALIVLTQFNNTLD